MIAEDDLNLDDRQRWTLCQILQYADEAWQICGPEAVVRFASEMRTSAFLTYSPVTVLRILPEIMPGRPILVMACLQTACN